jgi:DNA-sulfur modification-associated
MSIVELEATSVPRAPDIQYIRGGFGLGRTQVPFFSSSVPAADLSALLKLPSQIPFDPGRPIELEELFQRELDDQRVDDEIVPYLSTEGRLRFFNALTVVLLPLDPGNPQRLSRFYPTETGLAPTPSSQALESEEVGPVLLSHPEGDEGVGILTWNTRLTLPVVLDGQHRFWAINRIINEPGGRLRDQLAASSISALFLVLDERAGFASGSEISVLEACREIFIDLNKHAQTVPSSRLYLLDDRDVNAVALRSILAKGVDLDGGPVQNRVRMSPRC